VGICQSSGRQNANPDSAASVHGPHGGTKRALLTVTASPVTGVACTNGTARLAPVPADCWSAGLLPFLCPGPGMRRLQTTLQPSGETGVSVSGLTNVALILRLCLLHTEYGAISGLEWYRLLE